jgi:hypothetical protein
MNCKIHVKFEGQTKFDLYYKFYEVNVLQRQLKPMLQGVIYQRFSNHLKVARFKVEKNLLIRVLKISSAYQHCTA